MARMTVKEFEKITQPTGIVDTTPYEIAEALSALVRDGKDKDLQEQLTDALFDLKANCTAFASPDYNRALYLTLVDIAARYKLYGITLQQED